ncbi:MAG: hypothetical protein LBO20_09085, partial [Bifidobacteriaceae bacterium]|nr:hypothetical protein [Bifidobacteriaceae bacterium]
AAPPAAAPDPALASQAAPAPLPGAGSRQNSQVDAEAPGQRRPRIPFRKVASAGASGPGAGKDKAPSSVGPVAQSAADLKAGPDARVGAGLSNRSARTAAAASAAASAPGPQIGAPGRGPVDHTEKVATAGAAAAAGSSVATSGVDKAPAAKGAAATGAAKTGAGLSPPEAASPEAVKPTRPVEGWPDAGTVKPPARPAPRPSAGSRAAPEWAQLRTVMRAAETGDVSDSPTHPGEPAHKAPPPAASVVAPAPSPSAAARPLTGDNQPASPRGARAPRPAVGASVPRPAASASVPRPAAGVTASKAAAGAPAANPPDGAASAAPSGIGAVNQAGRTASAVGASVPRPAAGVTASKPAAGAPAPNPPDGAVSAAPSGAGAVNQAGRTASGGGAVDPAVAQAEVRLAELKRRIGWGDA